MIRKITILFLLVFVGGIPQKNPESALASSKIHLEKALFFTKIPNYNRDSIVYYLNQAMQRLDRKESLHLAQLTKIATAQTSAAHRIYFTSELDSIATLRWAEIRNLPVDKKENRILKYRFLMNWVTLKHQTGQQKEARQIFQKSLSIVQPEEDPDFEALILFHKGNFYERFGLPDERKTALKYLLKSQALYHKQGYRKNIDDFYHLNYALGCYYTNYKPDSVYYFLENEKRLLKNIRQPRILAIHYCALGRELITSPLPGAKTMLPAQYEEGRKNIQKAIEILRQNKVEHSDVYAYCYGLLADLDLKNKKYDDAISNYKKCYENYLKDRNRYGALTILEYIGKAYEQKSDLQNALKYKDQFYRESITFEKERNARGLRESELQVDLVTNEQRLVQKQNQQKIFIAVMVIGSFLLVLVYRNFRLKQKSSKQLAILNSDLGYKNVLLDKRNAENELLLKEIHHRVKNNLEVVSSLLALQSAQIDDPNTKEAMMEGQNRVNSIGIVHQKLYQGTKLGTVEMKDYLQNLGESILDSFGATNRIALKIDMNELDLDIDTAVPLGLIVNELLTNSVKYAFPKGENGTIIIKLGKRDNAILHLEFTDNGIGKSGITQGTGFGSQLILLLTNQLQGKMREESANGIKVIFDFKLKTTT